MQSIQKSLCVFVHYGRQAYIPQHVSIYLDELSSFFDRVILVTNQRSLDVSALNQIRNLSTLFVKNEGYDLGMFYKAFQTIDPTEYRQIACVNDSNILFNELSPVFTWSKQFEFDFWGLIDSYEKPWFSSHQENYHIQSHFIVFNRKAILKLPAYFHSLNIQEIFGEKDILKLRRTVIDKWEIGLSQFLINEGLSNGSYIDSYSYSVKYLHSKQANVGHKLYQELIHSGFPLIKKKIITKSSWMDVFFIHTHWENMIRKYGNREWEIEALIQELMQIKYESGKYPVKSCSHLIQNVFIFLFIKYSFINVLRTKHSSRIGLHGGSMRDECFVINDKI
jgi:lipopolysaccharide biosynthesis protein